MLGLSVVRVLGGAMITAAAVLVIGAMPGDQRAVAVVPEGSPVDLPGTGDVSGVFLDYSLQDNTPSAVGAIDDSASIAQGTPFVDIDAVALNASDWGNAQFLFIFPAGITVLTPSPADGTEGGAFDFAVSQPGSVGASGGGGPDNYMTVVADNFCDDYSQTEAVPDNANPHGISITDGDACSDPNQGSGGLAHIRLATATLPAGCYLLQTGVDQAYPGITDINYDPIPGLYLGQVSPTAFGTAELEVGGGCTTASPSPSPTDSPSPTPTDSPSPTPTPTPSPTPTLAPTEAPTEPPTDTPSPTPTASPTPTLAPTEAPTDTPSPTPTPTPTPSPTATATVSPSPTPAATVLQESGQASPSPAPTDGGSSGAGLRGPTSLPVTGGPAGSDGAGPLAVLLALAALACGLGVSLIRAGRR